MGSVVIVLLGEQLAPSEFPWGSSCESGQQPRIAASHYTH
jgi:hypothetical protein